ncbi:MAG: hypothetical protein ABJ275_07820 [Maricaulaceae bacterium]
MNTNLLLNRHPEALQISLQGMLFTLVMIVFSGLTFKLGHHIMAFTWLPMTAIFLWPRWSHPYLTPVLIGFLGLLADLIMGHLVGMSSLVYLIFFWLIKPTERENRLGFWRAWLEFSFSIIFVLLITTFLLGRIIDIDVNWMDLWRQIFVAICVFPAIYTLLAVFRRWLIDPDDVNYQ